MHNRDISVMYKFGENFEREIHGAGDIESTRSFGSLPRAPSEHRTSEHRFSGITNHHRPQRPVVSKYHSPKHIRGSRLAFLLLRTRDGPVGKSGMGPLRIRAEKEKVGACTIKRVAAGTHLPKPWLFEPA